MVSPCGGHDRRLGDEFGGDSDVFAGIFGEEKEVNLSPKEDVCVSNILITLRQKLIKKTMKTKFLLLTLILFVIGCASNEKKTAQSDVAFVDDVTIDTTYVELHRLGLDEQPLYPMSVFFAGDNLVVQESNGKVKTDLFKVYNNNKLVSKFGTIGQGPDDFKNPFLFDHCKIVDSCFWVEDMDKLVQFFMDADGRVTCKNTVNFPDEIVPVNQIACYQDSVIAFRKTDEYQLSFYDMRSKKASGYNFYDKPKVLEPVDYYLLNMNLYRDVFGICGDNIVIGYNSFKMIDIVSARQRKLIKRLYFKGYDANPIGQENGIPNFGLDYLFFIDFVIANDDCFYARSWDYPFIEIDRDDKGISKIYKIDYEGHIQKLYVLKQRIRSFTIKGNEIYAICLDPEEQEWMIYKGTLR